MGWVYPNIHHFGNQNDVWQLPPFDAETFVYKDNVGCVCSLVRKSAWEQCGGYDENMLDGYEDWDFWISLIEHGWKGYRLPEALFYYRQKEQSMRIDANEKREYLISRIILNHPKLYGEEKVNNARQVVATYEKNRPQKPKPVAAAQEPVITEQSGDTFSIVYLINTIIHRSGGNQTLLIHANKLKERGHQVTIATYSPRKPDWFPLDVDMIHVPEGKAMADYIPACDVAVSTYFSNTPELQNIDAKLKIYFAQGDQFLFQKTPKFKDKEQEKLYKHLMALSKESYSIPNVKFIANSNNLANTVEQKYGRKADAMVPVCVDNQVFRPLKRAVTGSRWRILIVGPDIRGNEIEPLEFKGIGDIREAMEILKQRYNHFTAVRMSSTVPEIFNDFPCEFYIAPEEEMKTYLYGTANILVYASHYDSCPRPPLEAMSAGAAVVCTATPGAMEYCVDGQNSLLVPIANPVAIADAVEKLMKDHDLRDKLIAGGLETARNLPMEKEWLDFESFIKQRSGIETELTAEVYSGEGLEPQFSFAASATEVEIDPRFEQALQLMKNYQIKEALDIAANLSGENPQNESYLHLYCKALFQAIQYDKSLEELNKYFSQNPNSDATMNAIGEWHLASGNFEEARKYFESAIEQNPGQSLYFHNLADYYFEIENFDAVVEILVRVLNQHPNDVETLLRFAKLYFESNDIDNAVLHAEKAYRAHPGSVEIRYQFLEYLKIKYSTEELIPVLQEIAPDWQKDAYWLNEIATLHWSMENLDEAIPLFEKAVSLDENNLNYIKNLIYGYMAVENFDQAVKLLFLVTRQFPHDFETVQQLANLYLEDGNIDECKSTFDSYLSNNPGDEHAKEFRDLLEEPELYIVTNLAHQGDLENALHVADEYLSQNPDSIRAQTVKANLLLQNEDAENAIVLLERIYEKNPGNVENLYKLGKLQILFGNLDEYKALIKAQEKLFSEQPILQKLLLEADLQEGLLNEAEKRIAGLVEVSPNDPELYLFAGNIYFHLNRFNDAFRAFKLADSLQPGSDIVLENLELVRRQLLGNTGEATENPGQ